MKLKIFVVAINILFYSSISIAVDKNEIYGFFPSKWPSNTIPVCWENPSNANAEGRKLTREAIQETWESHSNLEFIDWSTCHNRSMGIRILIDDDDGPHTKGLGSQLDGRKDGMVLNFTFNSWNRTCRKSLYFCIKVVAVHEFGHALGFAHEQNRPDAPRECQKERQGGDGDVYLSEYDPDSVMNYCNPEWSGGGTLSRKDIEGLQKWYGKPNVDMISAKEIADKKFNQGNYSSSYWWTLVCESIDIVYDKNIGVTQLKANDKPAKTQSQKNIWLKILADTVDDIYKDERIRKGNHAMPKNRIKRNILKACSNPKMISAINIADKKFNQGNYSSSYWWTLVCDALDTVYDKKIETEQPKAVGKPAKTQSQKNIWLKILADTVDDIYKDEKIKRGNRAMPKGKIKRNILKACPKNK